MLEIGQCLLFWLRYPEEMERLYETDEPDLHGLPNPDETLRRVTRVGDRAYQQAAELLEAFVPGMNSILPSICNIERVRNRLEDRWELRFRIAPRGSAPSKDFEIGLTLRTHERALIPWVWRRGGRKVEDAVIRILGRGMRPDNTHGVWDSGTISLGQIQIQIPERFTEPVPLVPLASLVNQAFAPFTAQQIDAVAAIVTRREEAIP